MKHLLVCVSVLVAVSVSSAKSFTTTGSVKRNPAQTGNVGPADAPPTSPAAVECKFTVNGSGGPEQSIPLSVKGSEATGDLEAWAKPALGGGSEISANINFRQVHGTMHVSTIWLTDEVTGVQTLQQDITDFPATMQSNSTVAMLLFSKNQRPITFKGKKLDLNNVQVVCSLVRKATI